MSLEQSRWTSHRAYLGQAPHLDWLATEAFIDPSDALLPRIVDTGLEAWREIQAFYRERGVTVGGPFDDE
jgi:hypothetical protein